MKVKKLENSILFIGVIAALVAFILMLISFAFSKDNMMLTGLDVFGTGFITLFSFKSFEVPNVLMLVLMGVAVICLIIWAVQIGRKAPKKFENWIKLLLTAVAVILTFALFTTLFVSKISFGGKQITMYDAIRTLDGEVIFKVLAILSIGFSYVSLMFCTIYAFINFGMITVLGENYRTVKFKPAKEQKHK